MEETVDCSSKDEIPAESKFAAVVFRNIQEIYIPGKDIRCYYSIKPVVSPSSNDWIGLYKVGWQSYKDYLCYEYSPVIQNEDNNSESLSLQNSVLFTGSKLPQEDAEFYQFCYVASDGEIRGASYPFQIQFSKPEELQCEEEEDENGDTLLIVRNRTTMLEDSLAKAFDENATLKASKEKAMEDCRLFQDMILQLETQKNEINTKLQEQSKTANVVKEEKLALEETLSDSAKKVKTLEEALQEVRTQTLELQKSVEVEKLRSVQTDEDQKKIEEERLQLLQDVSDGKKEVETLQELVKTRDSEIINLEEKVKKVSQENEALKDEHETMLHEKKTLQATLDETKQENLAMERSLSDQLGHMNLLKKENCKIKEELNVTNEEINQLSDSFNSEKDQVHKTHIEELKCLEEQNEKLVKKVEDCERALREAEETMEKVIGEADEQTNMHKELIEEYEKQISVIQEQLDQERAFNNSLSSASDRQVTEIQEMLNIQLGKVSTASQKIEVKNQEIKNLKEEIKARDKVISTMEVSEGEQKLELAKSKEQELLLSSANKESSLHGPHFALQTAHAQLKKQYLQAKKDLENYWRQKSDLKRQLTTLQSELPDSDLRLQISNLKKQIEDLRIRLNMGAEAYKAKFKECRKYQSQLKKVQKNARDTPQSPLPASVSEFEIRNLKQSIEDEKTATAVTKKSLENYKKEACENKEELVQVKKENEALQKKCFDIERELAMSHEEKEKRLSEDKELQSHIDCLHHELKSRTEAIDTAEEEFLRTLKEKESIIGALVEENENLQTAIANNTEDIQKKLMSENEVLKEEVLKQKKRVEDLHNELLSSKNKGDENAQQSATNESGQQSGCISNMSCPLCTVYYPPNYDQAAFESHVNSHFFE